MTRYINPLGNNCYNTMPGTGDLYPWGNDAIATKEYCEDCGWELYNTGDCLCESDDLELHAAACREEDDAQEEADLETASHEDIIEDMFTL